MKHSKLIKQIEAGVPARLTEIASRRAVLEAEIAALDNEARRLRRVKDTLVEMQR